MTRRLNALRHAGAILCCTAGPFIAVACSGSDPKNETNSPSPASPTATTSQPSLGTSTTEPPPTPEKTQPGGIGGTG
jgi:hypothetical protein